MLLVRGVDAFGNVDSTPARHEWRSIAPPLEPTITSVPPEPSIGNSHTFEFTTDEPNGTFECRITPNPLHINTFEPCSSPHTYTNLPDGEYIFEVRAVNEFGIAGELPAEHEFEVGQPARHHDPRRPERNHRQHDRGDRLRLQRAGLHLRVLARR